MAINFDEKSQIFNLSTPNDTYLIGLLENKLLVHLYTEIDNFELKK